MQTANERVTRQSGTLKISHENKLGKSRSRTNLHNVRVAKAAYHPSRTRSSHKAILALLSGVVQFPRSSHFRATKGSITSRAHDHIIPRQESIHRQTVISRPSHDETTTFKFAERNRSGLSVCRRTFDLALCVLHEITGRRAVCDNSSVTSRDVGALRPPNIRKKTSCTNESVAPRTHR